VDVLFLAHLCADESLILDELQGIADLLLADEKPANLETEVTPLNQLGQTLPKLILSDSDPEQNRERLREQKDENLRDRDPALSEGSRISDVEPDTFNEMMVMLLQINAGFKTIQILGQVMRHSADSMASEKKADILRRVFGLARRILGSYFRVLARDYPTWAENLAQVFRDQDAGVTDEGLLKQVSGHIFGVSELVCFSVVKSVSLGVGHDAVDDTVDEVLGTETDLASRMFGFSMDGEVRHLLEKETGHILVAGETHKEAPWAREYHHPCRPTSPFVSFSPADRAAMSARS
jgi:hypothetical protein